MKARPVSSSGWHAEVQVPGRSSSSALLNSTLLKFHPVTSSTYRTVFTFMLILVLAASLASCGGGGGGGTPPPPNVGGGYTLQAAGGTLNDGTATKGLVVLATLRDGDGNGPGAAAGWTITITGPGIITPLTENYDDGSPSSYITWRWKNITPQTSTYKASATNGSVTLTYNFSIDVTKTLPNSSLTKSSSVISWPSVANAGSYYYLVTDGSGTAADYGYLSSSQNSFTLPVLPDGSYNVDVYAHTKNRLDLMTDPSPTPGLPTQENMSLSQTTFSVNGSSSGYYLNARGGTLYMGQMESGVPPVVEDIYGLSIWTSISAPGGTPPAGPWIVKVTGPGLPLLTDPDVFTFTYPGTYSHYLYWDFGFAPKSGTYTVTATDGVTTLTDSFTIPNVTAKLPGATGISLTQTAAKGGNVSWNPIPGASSYYVNIWAMDNGVYTEIAAGWVNTNAAIVAKNTFISGTIYDVYVTASSLDMTTAKITPPPTPGTQVDMSDTYFTYYTFTAK
jgi:hypothetical protein